MKEKDNEKRPITLTLPGYLLKQIDTLLAERGYMNRADCIRQVLQFGLAKMLPPYLAAKKVRESISPEERARITAEAHLKAADARAEAKAYHGKAVCDALGGTVDRDERGTPYCTYESYTEVGGGRVDSAVVREALEDLRADAVDYQFRDINGATGPEAKKRIQSLAAKSAIEKLSEPVTS